MASEKAEDMRPINNYHPEDCGCDICCPEPSRQEPSPRPAGKPPFCVCPNPYHGAQPVSVPARCERCGRDVAPTDDSTQPVPRERPEWERQESCPECDGDGCLKCFEASLRELREENEKLRQQLDGIALAKGSDPLVCYVCGRDKGPHVVVYQYCYDHHTKAESAEAELARCKEQLEAVTGTLQKWISDPRSNQTAYDGHRWEVEFVELLNQLEAERSRK